MRCTIFILFAAGFLAGGCMRTRSTSSRVDYPYLNPLTSAGAMFSSLPAAAQNSIRAEGGAAEISDIATVATDEQPVYAVYFRNPGINPPLYIAPNGDVLYPDLSVAISAFSEQAGADKRRPVTGLHLEELPPEVIRTIQQNAPGARIGSVNKQPFGSRTLYEIIFQDEPQHPRLYIAQDGTLLQR